MSIGNSFSQDAHNWLHKLAKLSGFDIETANLCIGDAVWKCIGQMQNKTTHTIV